ncbi:MAG: 4Fe-4S binding protein [Promethearchaeota archaeon]|nr:MAG: 4Fe-4S binding protein [Candidatus Lokiarchaeota archaeon]
MRLSDIKLKDHTITIIRRIVQVTFFLLINYLILEFIFTINLTSLEGIFKVFPVLNSPRNPLSEGTGIIEIIFYSIGEGIFPALLIGIFIIIILFTNRFFCGWVCPIGTIQDLMTAIPTKKRKFKPQTHNTLLKVKYVFVILLVIIVFPLGVAKNTSVYFYLEYKNQIGLLAQKPVGFFSLSEFIFVYFPNMVREFWLTGNLLFFNDFGSFVIFAFYIAIIAFSLWYPRFYCRYFCPYAGIASVISDYSFLKLARNPVKCVGRADCGICEKVCPKQIRILDEPFEFFTGKGECNFCMKCKEDCPYDAINVKFGNV